MCWNNSLSIKTFFITLIVVIVILINNNYSSEKKTRLQQYISYFLLSIILMQLIEYFIWRNIENKLYNNIFSILGVLLLASQPIMSLNLIEDPIKRNYLIKCYSIPAVINFIYNINTHHIHTTISKKKHLQWNWQNTNIFYSSLTVLYYLFFLTIPFYFNGNYITLLFGGVSFISSLYLYKKDGSFGSIWCYFANVLTFYYAFIILIYLPFIKVKY
jgi:hypothetical protein